MRTQTQTNKETKLSIANDDWSVLEGIGGNDKRFQIKSKLTKNNADTDVLINNLAKVAIADDKIISDNAAKDELSTPLVIKKITKPAVTKKTTVVKKQVATTKQVVKKAPVKNMKTETVSSVKVKEEVAQKSIASVNPQTTTVATSSEIKAIVNEVPVENKLETLQSFLKFIFMGFMHLYVKETNSVLKPLEFIAKNSYLVGSAVLHLVVPMFMTWLATTKIDAVVTKLATEGTLMTGVYIVAFYFASIFLWISGLVLSYGIFSMVRKSLQDVAKVGKDGK